MITDPAEVKQALLKNRHRFVKIVAPDAPAPAKPTPKAAE
jgi:hypothetical protein